jgi:hypothetical protein
MKKLTYLVLLIVLPAAAFAQSRKPARKVTTPKPIPTPAAKPVETPAPAPAPEAKPQSTPENVDRTGKKNGRPTPQQAQAKKADYKPVYVYTFDRAGFAYSHVRIEHDEDGRGRVWLTRDGSSETFDDPIQLSAATMQELKEAFARLNFLDSKENYQYEREYLHMGEMTITLDRDGRSRTVSFNWTDQKDAKILMDTYRGLSYEAQWTFEMQTARENQPLLTPGLVDNLDGMLRRKEIPDPPHLLPVLTAYSSDERLPLIARNHLTKLIEQIRKKQ